MYGLYRFTRFWATRMLYRVFWVNPAISSAWENETGHMYGLYRFKRGFGGQVDELAGAVNYL